jgi:hypothetical protein
LKYLVVIGLVVLLFVLLYRRLRPYLKIAGNFLNTIRQFQQQINTNRSGTQQAGQQAEKLVRCETCDTWVPIGRALGFGAPGTFYCSADCRRGREAKRRSAS